MLLLHDIVEIDAGDTYCYDEEGKKTQHEREQKAADRIFGLLPDDQCEKLKIFGLNLKMPKQPRQNLPILWTMFSP